jgi:hypothetical protein
MSALLCVELATVDDLCKYIFCNLISKNIVVEGQSQFAGGAGDSQTGSGSQSGTERTSNFLAPIGELSACLLRSGADVSLLPADGRER